MDEKKQETKKNFIQKLKDKVPDRDEQFEYVGLGVRLVLLTWATLMLSLSYLDLSKLGIPQQKIDPTFIASIFVGLSSTFGANITQKGEKGAGSNGQSVKAELKEILGDTQIIRVQNDITLKAEKPKIDKISGKEIDNQTGRLIP
tara:strand:- start:1566 stop:2000 length:435 start_codon:yes stop_codon:yes gene_type:complete